MKTDDGWEGKKAGTGRGRGELAVVSSKSHHP